MHWCHFFLFWKVTKSLVGKSVVGITFVLPVLRPTDTSAGASRITLDVWKCKSPLALRGNPSRRTSASRSSPGGCGTTTTRLSTCQWGDSWCRDLTIPEHTGRTELPESSSPTRRRDNFHLQNAEFTPAERACGPSWSTRKITTSCSSCSGESDTWTSGSDTVRLKTSSLSWTVLPTGISWSQPSTNLAFSVWGIYLFIYFASVSEREQNHKLSTFCPVLLSDSWQHCSSDLWVTWVRLGPHPVFCPAPRRSRRRCWPVLAGARQVPVPPAAGGTGGRGSVPGELSRRRRRRPTQVPQGESMDETNTRRTTSKK